MTNDYIRREDAIIEMVDNNVDHVQGTDGRESEGYDGDERGWFEPIEDHTQLKYNPIRPIKYPSTERSFLRDESCQSNIIGKDNGKILGVFCYDAKT